jgi:hypothetical protein
MPAITETQRKINGFENASAGWHFGDGIPASAITVKYAHLLNIALQDAGFPSTDAFLGVGGQIQVNGYWANLYLESIIEDEKIYFLLEKNRKQEVEEKNIDILNAISRIHYWGIRWATSEFSTRTISTAREETLLMPRFLNQVLVVFPSLIPSVSTRPEEASANILEPIIDQSRVNHPFILKSPQNTYQIIASS